MIKNFFLIFSFVANYLNCFSQDAILKKVNIDINALKVDSLKIQQLAYKNQINLDVNAISLLKVKFPDIKGEDITICQKENLPDLANIDLLNKIVLTQTASSISTDHATRMATIMVGSGYSSPFNLGIATQSQLVSTNFTTLLPEPANFFADHQITVVNHSYGSGVENFYGNEAVAYDAFCKNQPDILHIFSSGNVGYLSDQIGKYKDVYGYANLSGNYKTAKNVLTVGAVDEFYRLLPSSSRGPAFDGRLKPELVAYSDEGTSAAAAIVSGTAALLQEAVKKQIGKLASSALIKAILVNSADDVGKKGVDFETGYGNVNAFKALSTINSGWFIESSVTNGEYVDLNINVPPLSKNLKVTLVWTDPEGILNTSKALINDLDLEVMSNQEIYKPWVLNSFPNADSLSQPAKRMGDHLNNIEQVSIEGKLVSNYKLRVKGFNIVGSGQNFSIAFQWDSADSFQWISPVKESKIQAGEPFTLRWNKNEAIKSGKIEISEDNGDWKLILESNSLSRGFAEVSMPAVFGKAIIRIVADGKIFVSDEFTISPHVSVTPVFFCRDSIGLQWEVTNNRLISKYQVFKFDLKATTWLPVNITNEKKIVLNNSNYASLYAVAPISVNNHVGFRSIAVSAKQEEVYCFYKHFALNIINHFPELSLECSSIENVKSVIFQKLHNNMIENISTQTVSVSSKNYYSVSDTLAEEGMNTYRVQLNLGNGQQVYTEYASVNVFKTKRFTLFPIPAAIGQDVQVQADKFGEYQIVLSDLQGKIISQKSFIGSKLSFGTIGLLKGVYIYYINEKGTRSQTGKIVIN